MKHRAGSLAGKLLAFFGACPDEELTPDQIAEKYSVTLPAVYNAIRRLEEGGCKLENVRVIRLRSAGILRD